MHLIILLCTAFSTISAYEQEYAKPYQASAYNISPNSQFKPNIVSTSIFALGSWLHKFFFSHSSNNKPLHSWNNAQWDVYLHQHFSHLDQETYARSVIHYYEGYQYEGFCALVSQLSCPDHFFDGLRNIYTGIISENFDQEQHPFQDISPTQRDIIYARIAQILAQRNKCSTQTTYQKDPEGKYEEWHDVAPDSILHEREKALSIIYHHEIPYLRDYHLSEVIEQLLYTYDIPAKSYYSLTGIRLQHVLHNEAILLLDQFAHHKNKDITEIAVRFIDVSHAANKIQLFDQAVTALNISWIMLKGILAVGKGVLQGAYRTADHSVHLILGAVKVVLHPIMTVQKICKAAYHTGKFLSRYIHLIPIERLDGEFDVHIHFDERCAEIPPIITEVSRQVGQYLYDHPYDSLSEGTAFATEWILFPKVCTALATLFSKAKYSLPKYIRKIKKGIEAFEQEDIPAAVAAGTVQTGTRNATGALTSKAASAVTAAQRFIQEYTPYLYEIEQEIIYLKILFDQKYKGFAECANKFIKIPYRHILGIEFEVTAKGALKWSGFHHDYLGKLEKSGLVKLVNKVMGKEGIYKAEVIINGIRHPEKTFFPQYWSREKVINEIMEVYGNFIKSGKKPILSSTNKYEIVGETNKGIKIKMFITKNGAITSAYPKF